MKFRETSEYPFPARDVLRVFCDANYFLARYGQDGANTVELVEDIKTAESSTITIRREVSLDGAIPAFAQRFLPKQMTVVQTESWNTADYSGTLVLDFVGLPADVRCEMKLEDAANGSALLELDFNVKINIPLVGEKLAGVIVDDLKKKSAENGARVRQLMGELIAGYGA